MSCIQTNILAGASGQGTTGYEIERSLRFNSADSAYLNRTPSSAGNLKLWTWSGWVKRPDGGSDKRGLFGVNNTNAMIRFNNDDGGSNLRVLDNATGGYDVITKAKYRDPSAWYHFVVSLDTTELTAADRVKIYVNGVRENTFFSASYPTQNQNLTINTAAQHNIGRTGSTNNEYLNAYLADVHFIDGQALAPTNFGETDANGVWQPIKYAGTYGTNGFHLDFKDNSSNAALGTDSSGANISWSVNNLVAAAAGLSTANQGFDAVTYTGTASTQSITGLAFQPDFVWLKRRDAAGNNNLQDVVRGASAFLQTDGNGAESSSGSRLASFDSNGFTVTSDNGGNASGGTYIAWAWKAAGAASSNTDGTITSSVSANTSYGFSITSYVGNQTSGATIGHGLNAEPKFAIIKSRDTAIDWIVYHASTGNTGALRLNTTQAVEVDSKWFNNAGPSSSTFTLGNTTGTNKTGDNMIAYMWSEVPGFSKFSSYSGNGSTTGPVITTGFKPKFVMVKASSIAGEDWVFMDTARAPSNPSTYLLSPNIADPEYNSSVYSVDFLDNGFQIKNNNPRWNQNGATYIYAAFADKPDGSIIDSLVDTPTNAAEPTDTGAGGEVVGNYATLNPLNKHTSNNTLSNGNLEFTTSGSDGCLQESTIGMSSGKFYFEVVYSASGTGQLAGIRKSGSRNYDNSYIYTGTANKYTNGGSGASYGATLANGDVIGTAFDADNGTLTFYKNGVSQGTAFTGISGTYSFFVGSFGGPPTGIVNFGQRAFAYTAPSGFKSLNTANLPTPTIADGSTAFNGVTYTGDGNSPRDITGYSFSPDLVWYKQRDSARDHQLYDIVRGAGTDKSLATNTTYAENANDDELYGYLSAFNSDGFEVTTGSTNYNYNNNSGSTYVAWAWDAGSSTTTIAVGGLNSATYDQSQTWSNLITPYLNSPLGSGDGTQIFDGSTSTQTTSNNTSGSGIKFTPTSNISGIIELWLRNGDTANSTFSYSLDGGSNFTNVTTVGGSGSYVNIGQQTITTTNGLIVRHVTTAGTNAVSWRKMRVSGIELIDSGVSVTNVPSIASTVRANPSAGFSIVTYTGNNTNSSVGHALNATPGLVIVKSRSATSLTGWMVKHSSLSSNYNLALNLTDAAWNPVNNGWVGDLTSSSTFSLVNGSSNGANVNESGTDFIAYCFAPIEGYSAMGSYTGNGSADGPFVALSFRPAFLLIKNSSLAGSNWIIIDTARDTFNEADHLLKPNSSNAEQITTANEVDILSNGFKPRGTDGDTNGNGNTLVYAAFAEHPFKTARAR